MASRAPRVALPIVLAGLIACTGGVVHAACPAGRATGARGDTLVIGFTAGSPFVITTSADRQVRGVAIDLLRTLAAREGWRIELVELGLETLRRRLANCELDVGAVAVVASAALIAPGAAGEPMLELSQPYFSTVTTAIVSGDDQARAGPAAGHSRAGRVAHRGLRALVYGLAAKTEAAIAG